jgi:hypothetical protein
VVAEPLATRAFQWRRSERAAQRWSSAIFGRKTPAGGEVVEGPQRDLHQALPTRNPWDVLNFLVNPQDRLNGAKPIERLRAGAVEEVVAAARTMGEHAA